MQQSYFLRTKNLSHSHSLFSSQSAMLQSSEAKCTGSFYVLISKTEENSSSRLDRIVN